jgi:hypothetical protein
MTELPIERDLREALAVDHSPEFGARVRARIAEEPARVDRRFGFWFWMPIAAAALATVALAVMMWPSHRGVGAARADVLASRSFGANPASLSSKAASPTIAHVDTPSIRPRTDRVGHAEPEILISPSESRAILNLIAGIRSGRIDPASLPKPTPAVDLDIPPIVIAPLRAVDGAEGARQ